jgi:hypothetical protein
MAEWHRGAVGGKLQTKNRRVFGLGSSFGEPQQDRTHLGLENKTPDGRIRSVALGQVLSQVRLGGMHHRCDRAA